MLNRAARPLHDCLIIGGGPAGLTAATYLGRFQRKALVVDNGLSRARWIPTTHNCPGFPDGINGIDLLARMRRQAGIYGTEFADGTIDDLCQDGDRFGASMGSVSFHARSCIIATGIVDNLPEMPDREAAILAGKLRLCPICDGYEMTGRTIAIMGTPEDALKKALFMQAYTSDVTLMPLDASSLENADLVRRAREADVRVAGSPVAGIVARQGGMEATFGDGSRKLFDAVYPAMGCDIRSGLAQRLGASTDAIGNLVVCPHQQTNIPGLYAAGDVVNEINQLAVAFGHAAIAATHIHNSLAQSDGQRLEENHTDETSEDREPAVNPA